jgi:quinol monooxygenase YgiN
MIRHTVAFRLRHRPGSTEERSFLDAATALAAIPGVERFEQFDQVSPKNSFSFGFSMEFADRSAYDAYNTNPIHVAFVRDRWAPEVEDFLELDYVPLTTELQALPA